MYYRGAEGKIYDNITIYSSTSITVINIRIVIGALLIYDITDISSFDKVKEWLIEV